MKVCVIGRRYEAGEPIAIVGSISLANTYINFLGDSELTYTEIDLITDFNFIVTHKTHRSIEGVFEHKEDAIALLSELGTRNYEIKEL